VRLRDLGNTVIVVEHDEETIREADHVVDIGPGAGEHGGDRLQPAVPGLLEGEGSVTGPYLVGETSIPVPTSGDRGSGEQLVVRGAREHNLHDIDVAFPLGCLVAVTGVSGSGKSTLVNDILLQSLLARSPGPDHPRPAHRTIDGVKAVDKVVAIDQSPIGRTPRSNPATYTGLFDHVRKLFSQTRGQGPRLPARAGSPST
jgi:excinuclease ABC subunit A